LARLTRAEFLYKTRLFPEIEYAFKHALTHEVAYAGRGGRGRRTVHVAFAQGDPISEERECSFCSRTRSEQLADQAFRDFGAHPAPQEAQQGGRVAIVDRPEGLGLTQRAADRLRVRGRAHHLLFPDRGRSVRAEVPPLLGRSCGVIGARRAPAP